MGFGVITAEYVVLVTEVLSVISYVKLNKHYDICQGKSANYFQMLPLREPRFFCLLWFQTHCNYFELTP